MYWAAWVLVRFVFSQVDNQEQPWQLLPTDDMVEYSLCSNIKATLETIFDSLQIRKESKDQETMKENKL